MHRLVVVIALAALLGLSGCAQLDSLRIVQDKPEHLEQLLQQHEYARARLLTVNYPSLDSLENRTTITHLESEYEAAVFEESRKMEAENDLLGAVNYLTRALQKLPNSTLLRELRTSIEQERVARLQTNEREQLLSRASYMLEQQKLYTSKINLESPSITQRWENTRNEKEAKKLSSALLQQGVAAMEKDQLEIARQCLQLSNELLPSTQASALLSDIEEIHASREQVVQQQASIKKAKKRRKVKQKQTNMTKVLLQQTQQAMAANDLQQARAALVQIPPSSNQQDDVLAVQQALQTAIDQQVAKLLTEGDTLYRADNVLAAVRIWTEGLSLDPENPELRERVERANRVLAKLEELKGQQPQ